MPPQPRSLDLQHLAEHLLQAVRATPVEVDVDLTTGIVLEHVELHQPGRSGNDAKDDDQDDAEHRPAAMLE